MSSTECNDNQLVRLQNPDPVALIEDNTFYNPTYYQQIDPSRFVGKIDVPVYLSGAWQDEQTGGHFPDFIDKFTGSKHVYATLTNGSHTESLVSMGSFGRLADFLSLYVARTPPNGIKQFVAPLLASNITGIDGLQLTPQPNYSGLDLRQARRLYDQGGPIRVLFEEGAAANAPSGAPVPRFTRRFASWPIPSGTTTRYYLQSHGRLGAARVTRQCTCSVLLGRPVGSAVDRLPRQQRGHLGRAPGVRLAADPAGQGPRLDHVADEEGHHVHRVRLARRVGQDAGRGRRPRGDRQCRAAERS